MSSQERPISEIDSDSDIRNRWNAEYGALQVIPSSIRSLPSKALVQYDKLLPFERIQSVLDIGCGNGRNAIYLAKKGCSVHAIDASPIALQMLAERAAQAQVKERIRSSEVVLGKPWPFESGSYDLTLDSFVFCHLLHDEQRVAFRDELHRVTRKTGFAYSSLFCTDDEYYQPLLTSPLTSKVVVDPRNSVPKRLYEQSEIEAFFGVRFRTLYQSKFMFNDVVQGHTYRRSILSFVLEPRS